MNKTNGKRRILTLNRTYSVWNLPEEEAIICPFNASSPDERVSYFNHPWLPDAFWYESANKDVEIV